jgi:hypothetical protein
MALLRQWTLTATMSRGFALVVYPFFSHIRMVSQDLRLVPLRRAIVAFRTFFIPNTAHYPNPLPESPITRHL